MIRIDWSSTSEAYEGTEQSTIDQATLESLFTQWQAADPKWQFMSRLPVDQAAALTDLIMVRVPRHVPVPKKR